MPFIKTLKTTASVKPTNFQNLIQTSDFNTYYVKTVFDLPENLVLINFQDSTNKSDFGTYYSRTAFDLPEKLMETKIQMFLEY